MDNTKPPPPESQAAFDAIRRANSAAPEPEQKSQTGGHGHAGVLGDKGEEPDDEQRAEPDQT